jgi:hypothetical protein
MALASRVYGSPSNGFWLALFIERTPKPRGVSWYPQTDRSAYAQRPR